MDLRQELDNRVIEKALNIFISPIRDWLDQHPWLDWLLVHPLWLLGLVLLAIFLFAGLIQAIGRLTENIWLTLLGLPLRLVKWLAIGLVGLVQFLLGRRQTTEAKLIGAEAAANSKNRLQNLLDRLEVLRGEEEALLKEVKELLAKEGK